MVQVKATSNQVPQTWILAITTACTDVAVPLSIRLVLQLFKVVQQPCSKDPVIQDYCSSLSPRACLTRADLQLPRSFCTDTAEVWERPKKLYGSMLANLWAQRVDYQVSGLATHQLTAASTSSSHCLCSRLPLSLIVSSSSSPL